MQVSVVARPGPSAAAARLQLGLLRVGQLLAGELPGDGLERPHLRGEPAVVELVEELGCVGGKACRLEGGSSATLRSSSAGP